MDLRSLLLCSDEKIVRILRRTLSDLDIVVEHCASADAALSQLTRDRFEAIIVDCADPGAAEVLRNCRTAPQNRRAVAAAILDPDSGLRSAFKVGANFVLYKPVSMERAKSSFRAARALMKKERRRNTRVSVQIPVEMSNRESGARLTVNTRDVSQGGLAISLPRRSNLSGRWQLSYTLPGSDIVLEVAAELAWEGKDTNVGLRFEDPSALVVRELREWLSRNCPDSEKDDPPIRCQLTDWSLGACYLAITSPFPVTTRVTLSMSAAGIELRTEGVVRVMHPERGMGVQFTQTTPEHRELLQNFLSPLTKNHGVLPELLLEPQGLETEPSSNSQTAGESGEEEDPLLRLFRNQAALSADLFLEALRQQRGLRAAAAGAST